MTNKTTKPKAKPKSKTPPRVTTFRLDAKAEAAVEDRGDVFDWLLKLKTTDAVSLIRFQTKAVDLRALARWVLEAEAETKQRGNRDGEKRRAHLDS